MPLTTKNNFIIVGAQRSATTYLYHLLDQHPDICMARPLVPEPKFFIDDEKYGKGIKHYYDRFFSHYNGERIIGEKSTSYFELDIAAQRINKTLPDATILVCLRNPIDRAISNYLFSVKHGLEKRSLDDVFLNDVAPSTGYEGISVDPFNYIGRSDYLACLERYWKIFTKRKVLVIIAEKLITDKGCIKYIYDNLGVDDFNKFIIDDRMKNGSAMSKITVNKKIYDKLRFIFAEKIVEFEGALNCDLSEWKV